MTLAELKDGQPVRYRYGRGGDSDATGPSWGPWTDGELFVFRRNKDLQPAYLRKRCAYWRAGDIVTITIRDLDLAEYSQADYQGDGLFLAEDYYLEIGGLE